MQQKSSSVLYTGRCGESKALQVSWREEGTLLIDGTPYAIGEKQG